MPKVRNKRSGPKPEMPKVPDGFIEAFMIIMLHKIGGSQTLSLEQLEKFGAATECNKTKFSYDEDKKSITITAPEYGSVLVPEKKGILTCSQ